MAITFREGFSVQAPIGEVWSFLLDPNRVVLCMPGAELEEIVDENVFRGRIKVKVGPIVANYTGKVVLTEVDEDTYSITMTAEGLETAGGGGSARGNMSSRLQAGDDGSTEIIVDASVEVTGRLAQFGRGIMGGVSNQLFREFASCCKQRLEAGQQGVPEEELASTQEAINIVPVFVKALWAAVVRFFRQLFGRSDS
jgi:carbon monoxide dehydrogenase subunit G